MVLEVRMSLFILYLVMLKATATTFNGPMSLPILREELVVKRPLLTDRELTAAVTAAQSSPGPMGIYVVSVGYFAAGVPGAVAGYAALVTPAFAAIPLMLGLGRRLEHPRARSALDAMVIASAGLILISAAPLARESIRWWMPAGVAIATLLLLVWKRVPTIALIGAAALLGALTAVLEPLLCP
jgi:chromate transporter